MRVISEGGGSLARSPRPVCIDSIQATQTCTTESQHALYRSPTACSSAATADNLLFSVPVAHAEELDHQLIPDLLRHRLERRGDRLGTLAQVEVRDPGRLWCICDEGRSYSIRKLTARLAVYLGAS
ncbi:MAG TPA: hypothetical protein DCZ75_08700 [Geobacter sp.]|nr:hypothetical protein [Geobacter sp.]